MMTKEQSAYQHPRLHDMSWSNLSICLHLAETHFAYKVSDENDILAFDQVEVRTGPADEQFFDWIRENELLRQNYGKAEARWSSPKFTLVPGNLFNEYQAEAYIRNLFTREPDEIVKTCAAGENQCVFTINEKIYYALRSKFFDAPLLHECAANLLRTLEMNPSGDKLYAFFYSSYLQLVHVEDGRLQFINNYVYSKEEEAVYHLVNYYERMKLSRQRVVLHTEGLDPAGSLYTLLSSYILQTQPEATRLPEGLRADPSLSSFLAG